MLLRLIARWLERAGHTIVLCSSRRSAQARTVRLRSGDDLLIMDLTPEDRSSVALMLKARIPGLKLLFISEQSMLQWSVGNTALWHALAPGTAHVLRKPFTGLELLTKVDELIGAQPKEAHLTAGTS
jgi:hypothetical protein